MIDLVEPIWERQPGESAKHFGWFEAFRLAGPARTVLGVYRQQDPARLGKAQSPSGTWSRAAREWCWHERAKAYDDFVLEQTKDEREQKYREELEEHRERAKNLAIENIEIANLALQKIKERISVLHPNEIEPKQIPAFLRAAADMAERALNAEGHALGLDELLGTMSDDQPNQ